MKQPKNTHNKSLLSYARACAYVLLRAVSPERSTALTLIFVLSFAGVIQAADSVKQLIRQLRRGDDFSRRSAAAKLGLTKDPRGVQPLIKALKDKNADVRRQAADSLGLIRAAEAIPDLAHLLKHDPDPNVSQTASLALSYMPASATQSHFLSCLQSKDRAVLFSCIRALGQSGSKDALKPLKDLLANADNALKTEILKAYVAMGVSGDFETLKKDLNAKDYSVRVAALRAMGLSQNKKAVSLLKPFVKKLNPGLKTAACWSLSKLGQTGHQKTCGELLYHPDSKIRKDIAEVLGSDTNPETLGRIRKAHKIEKNRVVKQTLSFALKKRERQQ